MKKLEIMDEEALLRWFDPHGIIFNHGINGDSREAETDFRQQQEDILLSSNHLFPLPLTATSLSDMGFVRNLEAFLPSCEAAASSGLSQTYPDSLANRHCSTPKLGMRKSEDSCNSTKFKKSKLDCPEPSSINFRGEDGEETDSDAVAQVKEIVYIAAALRPVVYGEEEAVEKPRRKNLKISSDPQTAAARHRRERISDRLRVLQRLVPGGRKMDTASMLDEAANYLKFLKAQVTAFENIGHGNSGHGHLKGGALNCGHGMLPFPVTFSFYSSPNQACTFPLQNP